LLVASSLSGCGEPQARAANSVSRRPTTDAPPAADPWAVTPTQPVYHATPVRLQEPDPVHLDIPAIGVATDLVTLGLRLDGTMDVPKDFARAGWFTGGPRPGENGPALIAGHVDSYTGPAVFYRLRELQPGNDIAVRRKDGSVITFTVSRVETFAKQAFPTDRVFGPTTQSELRLVTCGGDFDWSKRSYKSNVVVYAALVPV
jgi:sortase (surface protein transpeptidase)